MARRFVYEEMNRVGRTLFGYELLPEKLWPDNNGEYTMPMSPKSSIDLYSTVLDYDMFTSIYCHDYKDLPKECPACPFSKHGGCEGTEYEEVITRYNNWRSVPEIVNTLTALNRTRESLVIAMLNEYLDTAYEKPFIFYDDERGYNIDEVFYFGSDILFKDNGNGRAILDEDDILYLPFEILNIDDIVLPMAEEDNKMRRIGYAR